MALSFAIDPTKGEIFEDAEQKRKDARMMIASALSRSPRNVGEGLSAIGKALIARQMNQEASAAAQANAASNSSILSNLLGITSFPSAPGAGGASGGGVDSVPAGEVPANWENIQRGIFKGESGGDYDALFGFSNHPGKQFANTKLTDMTVDQALAFADPSGPYGQWVKGQIGRVATPMGAYQVVGTTLRGAKQGLGLKGNEIMSPAMQDRIGQWILANQGTGAWAGYKGPIAAPPGAQAAEAMATGQPVPPAPTQVASLDPSIGMITPAAPSTVNPQQAGQPVATDPKTQRIMGQMMNPQPMGGTPMSLGAPQPVAQADPPGVDLDRLPVTAGGNAGVYNPQQAARAAIAKALSSPSASPTVQRIAALLLERQMKQQDPATQLDMRYKQAQLDNLLNPQTKPTSDMQNYEFYSQQEKAAGRQPLSYNDWNLQSKRAGAMNINLPDPNANMFAGLPKDVRDEMFKRQEAAQDAADLIGVTNQGLQLLDQGAITGAGSDAKIAAIKWAQTLGVPVDGDIVDAANNTETYRSIMAKAVGKVIKNFGSGTGLSDADRQYAERLAGGDTTLNEPAIRRILAAGAKHAREKIEGFSTMRDKVLKGDLGAMLNINEPPAYTPPPNTGTTSGGLKWSIEP